MTPTEARDWAIRTLATDPDAALIRARGIADPWYASQALAWLARFAPEDDFDALVDEAFRAARRGDSPFGAVAASAWPLRACVERTRVERVETILPELLRLAPEIEPPASRSEALFLVFQAVYPAGQALWLPVFQELSRASDPASHWRQGRNLCHAMLMIARDDAEFARTFSRGVRDDRTRSKIQTGLAHLHRHEPRPFFRDATLNPASWLGS
jgi:hypothetical protein